MNTRIVCRPGVRLNGGHLRTKIAVMVNVAFETAPLLAGGQLVITSANDGKHMKGSRHYSDDAFDLRIRNILPGGSAKAWVARMQERLGDDYDVVLEEDHIHVEYDPK